MSYAETNGISLYYAKEALLLGNDVRSNVGGISLSNSSDNRLEGNDASESLGTGIMAGINRQAGNFDRAMEWHLKQVELETDPQAKAGAYKAIGSLMVSRLRGRTHEILGHERLEIADTGVGMLQKAAALAPEDADVQTALGFLYGERALAQSTTWAQIAEVAAARHHYKKWAELNKKAQQQAADPNQAPGAAPDKKPDGAGGAGEATGGDKKEG